MSIKLQIQRLAELQTVENDISGIIHLLTKIPEELETLDSQLLEFKLKIERVENKSVTLEKQYRDWEGDSQGLSSKIEKENNKLNSVKNNKEYQALLAGIEHLKTERSVIEDKMIESLEMMDEAKADLSAQKVEFKQFEAQLNRQREVIRQQSEKKGREREKLENVKANLVGEIEPAVIERYQHVKTLKGQGLAIAAVQDEVCKGCNMNIPPQLYNDLQRYESLLVCPNCQRIIYHDPPADSDG